MWRSNVLRLREKSSAAAWRNTRAHSSQTSLPISDQEFWRALGRVDDNLVKHKHDDFVLKIGFAISGGVDSMALAALFANLKNSKEYQTPQIHAHAFIVDHKVRPESTEEADWVAEQCRSKFDMQASVLPLSWPAGFDPLDHKRFETDARTLRYQTLGRACRAARIRTLLLAHHGDDQAETVLMRLANNRLRSGLQAMQPVDWIPECHGIHGVSHSGLHTRNRTNSPFPVEDGGVSILRPLLGFDKSRLIATCKHHGVAWAEDKTNHLQTYTSRNAIRHILKNHELPAALNIRSLVEISLQMQKRVAQHREDARLALQCCPKRLDIQAGSLLIRFPSFDSLFDQSPVDQRNVNKAKNKAYCLLEQAGQLITPRETAPLGELAATVANIWPEFLELEGTDPSQTAFSGNKTNYCIYSIWWRKWDRPSPFSERFRNPGGAAHAHPHEWLLTRQPLENHKPDSSPRSFQYAPSRVFPLTQDPIPTLNSVANDGYQLFDSRWWIRIRNNSADALTLRFFTKDDLAHIPSLHDAKRFGRRPERFIAAALSLLKPVDLRFTLPAVFRQDPVTKQETLVGFPTLDVSIGQLGSPEDVCTWQVRYKKIGHSSGSVVSGITHAMIEKELAKFDKKVTKVADKRNPEDKRGKLSAQYRGQLQLNMESEKTKSSDPMRAGKKRANHDKTVPLVPAAESQRRGRSENREGGGYKIKWEDLQDRFSC
ncbi:ATP binding [Ascochyta rabiei]|uniref:tRNA(Ile)-lysidine synthetase n=2 Tax=Didymella rabiei TaxID=5454 RepID=A0A163BJY2_DIDRA|nr:ATP binding [Ascochyta rabiei]